MGGVLGRGEGGHWSWSVMVEWKLEVSGGDKTWRIL